MGNNKRGLGIFDEPWSLNLRTSMLGSQGNPLDDCFHPGGLFANVGQVGQGSSLSPIPNSRESKSELDFLYKNLHVKYLCSPEDVSIVGVPDEATCGVETTHKRSGIQLGFKVQNHSLRRLISGAIAGAVSRTAVAPLETVRTHLMVGSCKLSTTEVFDSIVKNDGWKGLFRGNFVNVIRVAPSKAIELFAYETVKKQLSPKDGEAVKLCIPPSLISGACAGVCSTLCTYPLELLKTRLTIQGGAYKGGIVEALVKIAGEGGVGELYRGLIPSLIGVVPYAAINYFAYDTLQKAYRRCLKRERMGNLETLVIGSGAGAISSLTTFPLEVGRKVLQVRGGEGGVLYKNMLHALCSIVEKEGVQGLYRGVVPSCVKLVPAAGISFMCYEACKTILEETEASSSSS